MTNLFLNNAGVLIFDSNSLNITLKQRKLGSRVSHIWIHLLNMNELEAIDAHRGGEGGGGAPHVPPIKIFENFHIKMQ